MKFIHKKSLGQHFLNSDFVPKKMCDAAGLFDLAEGEGGSEALSLNVSPTTVLEIGPGTGALTREILARGANVVAIEADERAISSLNETFAEEITQGRLTIFHHDARTLNPSEFNLEKHSYICVSNIPYYLSGRLFRSLLDTKCQPSILVFLIQKEVAERIARDKKESLLSLSVKVFGDPSYVSTVKRGHFSPPPKVDSAIISVSNINQANFKDIAAADFFNLIHLGFGQKRKQLIHNLVESKLWSREEVEVALNTSTLPLTIRAEDIPLNKWLRLTAKLTHKKHP